MEALFSKNDWNTLELNVLPDTCNSLSCDELQVIPVHMDKPTWTRWMNKVGQWKNIRNPKACKLSEYYHMNLMDQYDARDDTHKITEKHYITDVMVSPKLYGVAYRTDQLPEYRFPNVKDLSSTAIRNRTSFWHTNRISIHFDETEWPDQQAPVYTMQVYVTCPEKVDKQELQTALQEVLTFLRL